MDGDAFGRARQVVAPLDFIDPAGPAPVRFQYDAPSGARAEPGVYVARPVAIEDARTLALAPALNREGFQLVRRASAVADLTDPTLIRDAYYPEIVRLLQDEIGAAEVAMVFDHNVRDAARATGDARVREPVKRVHNDYTERSAPRRLVDLVGEERAASWQKDGFAIVNVWRPLSPVLESPLALADARTLAAADLVSAKLVFVDRVGETYAVAWSPRQRWFWFPRLTPDEAILIRVFNSRVTEGVPFSAHGAFDDPTAATNAPARRRPRGPHAGALAEALRLSRARRARACRCSCRRPCRRRGSSRCARRAAGAAPRTRGRDRAAAAARARNGRSGPAQDRFGHFEHEPRPLRDLDPEFVALHRQLAERNAKILYAGTGVDSYNDKRALAERG